MAESEVKRLEQELERSRQECVYAGEMGMKLLEANDELQRQLEKDSRAYEEQLESLHQEVHSLNLKLLVHTKTNEAFEEELRLVKTELETAVELKIDLLKENHRAKVNQLNRHLEELSNEIEIREGQLVKYRQTTGEKEREIQRLRETLADQSNSSCLHGELSDLQSVNAALEKKCRLLMEEVEVHSMAAQETVEEKEIVSRRMKELEKSLEEKERVSHEWYCSLNEARDELSILRAEMEQQRMKGLREDWQAQGNSLFSEVEDRRLQTERDLITFKVKYESLERSHRTLQASYRKLKTEFTALLCRHSSVAADADHVNRLERMVCQRNSELEELNEKLRKLDKQRGVVSGCRDYADAFVSFGDKKEYIQYLEHEQKQTEDQLSSIKRELDLKSTQLIWECRKLTEAEARLHKCEKDKAVMLNQTCAMKLKLQEALDKQEHGKDHIRSLEKEIQLLKQQLQGRIKTGETFPWQQEREGKEKRVEEDKKQQPKKKQQQRRATINLLEVLQMSEDTTTNDITNNNGKTVDNLKTSCIDDKVGVASVVGVSPDKVSVASTDKENFAEVGVASAISDSSPLDDMKEVKCKTVLHKTVKVTDTIADMDQQCRQQ